MDMQLQITATPSASTALSRDEIQNLAKEVVDRGFASGLEKGKTFRVNFTKNNRNFSAALDYRENGLFLMIGASPNTTWLPGEVQRDDQGFVMTGPDVAPERWPCDRAPFPLETSLPGVFAAGDVRHGSVKRVASAVGEGSIAVQQLHLFFAAEGLVPRGRPAESAVAAGG